MYDLTDYAVALSMWTVDTRYRQTTATGDRDGLCIHLCERPADAVHLVPVSLVRRWPHAVSQRVASSGLKSLEVSMSDLELMPDSVGILIRDLAERLLENGALDSLEAASVKHIFASEPAYADCGIVVREIHRATRNTLRLALTRLAGQPIDDALQASPEEIGRLRAEQAVPLSAVLHAFRLDFRLLWAAMVSEAKAARISDLPEFADSYIAVWNAVESITEEVAAAYERRERELSDPSALERETAFRQLLNGYAVDANSRARCRSLLGLPEDGVFAVIRGAQAADHGTSLGRLKTALAHTDAASFFSGPPEDISGVIHSTRLPAAQLRGVLALLEGGQFGVAIVNDGLAGIPRGMRLAVAALRSGPRDMPGVRFLDDCLLEALLNESPELSNELLDRVLGPVLKLPIHERRRLLEILDAYLTRNGSIGEVAASMYLHRNTVRKRIARLEELTGRCLDQPAQAAELALAANWLRARTALAEADLVPAAGSSTWERRSKGKLALEWPVLATYPR